MFERLFDRRKIVLAGALALLAGCSVVPKSTAPAPAPVQGPSSDVLPTDSARHRIALLVPMTGENSNVGRSIANAATMALLDTDAKNLRVTNYDTSSGASSAAKRAIADGSTLFLGPLLSDNIPAVAAVARPAGVPLISFSNDSTSAARDVFIMGNLPGKSIERTAKFALSKGITRFGALVPRGEYGQRASDALMAVARKNGASVVAMESYDRSNTSVATAARKLRDIGGLEAILIADGGRMSSRAAPILKPSGAANGPRILGTELWSGEKAVNSTSSLSGAWFAAVADTRFGQFSKSYKRRFGDTPYRIATLGYDSVLLALRVARDWKPGRKFPTRKMLDKGGFLGLDGPFRFSKSGAIERAFEVREVRSGGVTVVSPAPSRFDD